MHTPTPEEFVKVFEGYKEPIRALLDAQTIYATVEDATLYRVGAVMGNQHFAPVEVARFRMRQLPGCSGIIVCHSVQVSEPYRGRGIGKLMHKLRLDLVKFAGWPLIQCTTQADDARQAHILSTHGWKPIHTFTNTRTGHGVTLWLYTITESD